MYEIILKIKQFFCKHQYTKVKCKKDYDYCKDYVCFSDVGMWHRLEKTCKKCGKVKISYVKDKR